MRRYAENTQVPISRSRAEIDKLLRAWKCDGIQWTDDFTHDRVMLRFSWPHGDERFQARFIIALEKEENVRQKCNYALGSVVKFSQSQYEKALARRGAREHRVLALWLKAALNAVEEGIVEAAALFLPFLEDRHGKTMAEIAVPRLEALLKGSGDALLLGDGKEPRRG